MWVCAHDVHWQMAEAWAPWPRLKSPSVIAALASASIGRRTHRAVMPIGNSVFADNKNNSYYTAARRPAAASLHARARASLRPFLGLHVLERYHRELLNFLSRQVRDRDTAADLAQESFVRVLAAQASGQAVLDMRALLYRTARNLVIDQHRRNEVRRHDELDALPEDQHPPAPRHLQPEELLASQQVIRAYLATIEALPARCREAFVLHVFEQCSHARIARHMGISVSMVEKHIVRAMVACKLCERRLRSEGRLEPGRPQARPEAPR
jgi:RNA polymerase sigma factor (sigma-70 family)